MVHRQQTFGTNNHYIQDDGCGHAIICALRPVNSGENTGHTITLLTDEATITKTTTTTTKNTSYKFTLLNTQNLVDTDSYSKLRVVPTFQARDGFVFL